MLLTLSHSLDHNLIRPVLAIANRDRNHLRIGTMRRSFLIGIVFLIPTLPCRGQQVGDSVVVIVPTAHIQIGEKVVDKAYRGAILVVRKVQGDWLAVSHGTPGWLHRDDAMLLGPAVDFFSTIIRDNPQDAGAYFVRGNIRSEQGEFAKAIT